MGRKKNENLVHSQVRLPKELRARLLAECERSGRSMNAELVFRLREALDRLDALPEKPPAVEGEESAADTLERLYRHAVQCTELIAGLKGKKPGAE